VYINDAKAVKPTKPKAGTLWTVTGIKFLFAILRNEILLNKPYRDIAAAAGVALGNIGTMLQQLQDEGYIKKDKQGTTTLYNKDKLIEKWAVMYETKLRPKLIIGRYRFVDGDWIGKKKVLPGIAWGGEAAATWYTGISVPEKITIYTQLPIGEVITDRKLIPDINGYAEVLHAFWEIDEIITPPLLTYADLIATFDSRNHEAALDIKQKYLDQ
jgi:hypothetical protein